jgi:hypothetical protein
MPNANRQPPPVANPNKNPTAAEHVRWPGPTAIQADGTTIQDDNATADQRLIPRLPKALANASNPPRAKMAAVT